MAILVEVHHGGPRHAQISSNDTLPLIAPFSLNPPPDEESLGAPLEMQPDQSRIMKNRPTCNRRPHVVSDPESRTVSVSAGCSVVAFILA